MAGKKSGTTNGHPPAGHQALTVRIEEDFQDWLIAQAAAVRNQRYASIDWSNVAEELEGMARRDRTELRGHLQNLIAHLLKWAYEPKRRGNSWRATINASRDNIRDLMEESPSLRKVLTGRLAESEAYSRAVRDATIETGGKIAFPADLPWSLEQLLDADFLPD